MLSAREARHASGSVEAYTPPYIIEAARRTMGRIFLDPASSYLANRIVKADHIFTKEDNAFRYVWRNEVFLNPPYNWQEIGERQQAVLRKRIPGAKISRRVSSQLLWSQTLLMAYEQGTVTSAILLVNAEVGSSWFKPLWKYPICFPFQRIKFLDIALEEQTQPTHANAIVYLGGDTPRFMLEFQNIGAIAINVGVTDEERKQEEDLS